jgi:hypothetical protein
MKNEKKISGSMWALLFFVSLRVIGSLAFTVIWFMSNVYSGLFMSVFFLLYLFSLIGLIKRYNWAFLLIIGICVIDIAFIGSSYEEVYIGGAIFVDILLIILAFNTYKQSGQKITRNQWVIFSSIVAVIFCCVLFYSFGLKSSTESNYTPEILPPTYEEPIIIPPTITVPTWSLYENKTVTVESESYYVYPIILAENQSIRFTVKTISDGVINTVLFNSTEYEKLTKATGEVYVYYFVESYSSGVRETDFWMRIPHNDTYYFIISTMPILRGQATYDHPVELILTVYYS